MAAVGQNPDLCPVLAEVAIDGDAPQRKVQDVSLQNTLLDTRSSGSSTENQFVWSCISAP